MRRALALSLIVACSSPVAPADRGDVGRFDLATIDGHRPPIQSTIGFVYWGGSIEFRADSTFVDVLRLGDATRATVVDSVFGRYRIDGDSIRMTPAGWTPYTVARQGDRLTAIWAEGPFVYVRPP